MDPCMSLTDPGPRNPLFFFSLALLGKVPNFIPNDAESMNQLECIEEAVKKLPDSPILLGSLGNVIAVTCDALLCLSASESRRSLQIRTKSIHCLHELLLKVSHNFFALLEIFPGVLSKMIKVATGRVDTEGDTILLTCLRIIETLLRTFWERQNEWTAEVVEKERFRSNVDVAIASLKPLVMAESRRSDAAIQFILAKIFEIHLLDGYKQRSRVTALALQLAALNGSWLSLRFQNLAFIEYSALMDWFDATDTFDEAELEGKLLILIGILSVDGAGKLVSIPQIFKLCLVRLFELHEARIGNVVDVQFSESLIGTENALSTHTKGARMPQINFKRKQKHFNEKLCMQLFRKVRDLDAKALAKEISSVSEPLLQMDLTAQFLQFGFDSDLFTLAMKHLRSIPTLMIEEAQLVQLAALKVLWSRFSFPSAPLSKADIQQHLPFVLLCSASQWLLLREVSTELLRFLAGAQNYESIAAFIRVHHEFLLDRLAIQLGKPGLFPEAPNIVAALLNHLLDDETVAKFSDLLVSKVSENLTQFRMHPAYCRGLLQVAEGTLTRSSKLPTASTLDLMRIAQYFIVADSKSVRISALKAFESGIEAFEAEDSELCQLIHVAWTGVMACLDEVLKVKPLEATQLDSKLLESLTCFIRTAAAKCPIFLRDRLVKDFWRSGVKKCRFANSLLISCLASCLRSCLFGTEVVLEILANFRDLKDIDEAAELFEAIAAVEPDALWHFFVFELGGLEGAELSIPGKGFAVYQTPAICPNPQLKQNLSLYFQ